MAESPPAAPDRPMGDILHALLRNVQDITRLEGRLVRAEWQQEVRRAAPAAGFLVAGAVLGLYALGFLLLTGVYALALLLPLWLATFSGFLVASALACPLLLLGRARVRRLTPTRPLASVKETVEWAKSPPR